MIVILIIAGALVFAGLIVTLVFTILKKAGALGPSKQALAETARLLATGTKARATILAIQPTGVVVNMINIRCDVSFRLEPIHGGPSHDVAKRMLLSETAMPRLGDTWPGWFDPTDPTTFTVQAPTALTPETVALYREFGIPVPGTPGT